MASTPNDSYVRAELSRMAAEGLLVKPRRGRYELPEQVASRDVSADTSRPAGGIPRAHVELIEDGPPPRSNAGRGLALVALYDIKGRRFGTRYLVSEQDFIPYAVTVHPDGTEVPRETNPSAA